MLRQPEVKKNLYFQFHVHDLYREAETKCCQPRVPDKQKEKGNDAGCIITLGSFPTNIRTEPQTLYNLLHNCHLMMSLQPSWEVYNLAISSLPTHSMCFSLDIYMYNIHTYTQLFILCIYMYTLYVYIHYMYIYMCVCF